MLQDNSYQSIKPLGSKNHIRKYKNFNQCSVFAANIYIGSLSMYGQNCCLLLALYLYCLILLFIHDLDLLHATRVGSAPELQQK